MTARTLLRSRKGASALEFALVGAAFFAMIIGITDLGRFFLTRHSLGTLADEGARVIIVNCGKVNNGPLSSSCASFPDGTEALITRYWSMSGTPTLSAATGAGTCASTGTITITATLPTFQFLLPVWAYLTGPVTQTATLCY